MLQVLHRDGGAPAPRQLHVAVASASVGLPDDAGVPQQQSDILQIARVVGTFGLLQIVTVLPLQPELCGVPSTFASLIVPLSTLKSPITTLPGSRPPSKKNAIMTLTIGMEGRKTTTSPRHRPATRGHDMSPLAHHSSFKLLPDSRTPYPPYLESCPKRITPACDR